jgi:hypothetical protein
VEYFYESSDERVLPTEAASWVPELCRGTRKGTLMLTRPVILLHAEGAAIFVVSVFLYRLTHASWLLFGLLFLSPDLFMLGYLAHARFGAALYNFAHTLTTPYLLLAVGFLTGGSELLPFVLIWSAHIGFDRLLGYGLKYPTHFKDTHLQHV